MKTFIKNASVFLFASVIVCVMGEVTIRFSQYDKPARDLGTAALWRSYRNIFVKSFEPDSTCSFPDRVVAHPYLGFVNQSFNSCSYQDINNKGFYDNQDIPYRRDPGYFTILVTGGSVAMHLAHGRMNQNLIWLQEYLNRDFVSPNGKPFRILQGAMGAWRTPTQNNIISLYGDAVDGVIAVDGWNEALNTSVFKAIDTPDNLYFELINTKLNFGKVLTLEFLRKWRNFFSSTSFFRDSFFAYFIFERTMGLLTDEQAMTLAEKSVFKHFNLPPEWSPEEVTSWNKEKFKTYQKLNSAQAKSLHIFYAHFLQPIRLIGKELTAEEKVSDFVTRESYENVFIAGTEELKKEGYPAYSLVHVFEQEKGTLYGDFIHCKYENDGDSKGYSILSLRISQLLKTAWNLKAKASARYGQIL